MHHRHLGPTVLAFALAAAATLLAPAASASLLTHGDFEGPNIVGAFNFDQADLNFWQGPGTGWDTVDDGSTTNDVADRADNFEDLLVQAIPGAGLTVDLTLAFDVFSTDEVTEPNPADNNSLIAKVFGIANASFDFDLAGGFDADFTSDTAGEGFVELASLVVPIANQAVVDDTFVVNADFDAGAPPYQFILVAFAGGFGPDGLTPATSVLQIDNVSLTPVPEPGSLALLGAGVALVAGRRRHAA